MTTSPSPLLASLVLLSATACAAPRTAQVVPNTGCYALFVVDSYGAVAAATGLRALPPFVGLDATPVGVRGHRLIVPAAWQGVGPSPEWASWRDEGRGLVLTFLGSTGTLDVALHPTQDGYRGEGVTPLRHAVPPVQVTLVAASCVGLRPGAA